MWTQLPPSPGSFPHSHMHVSAYTLHKMASCGRANLLPSLKVSREKLGLQHGGPKKSAQMVSPTHTPDPLGVFPQGQEFKLRPHCEP